MVSTEVHTQHRGQTYLHSEQWNLPLSSHDQHSQLPASRSTCCRAWQPAPRHRALFHVLLPISSLPIDTLQSLCLLEFLEQFEKFYPKRCSKELSPGIIHVWNHSMRSDMDRTFLRSEDREMVKVIIIITNLFQLERLPKHCNTISAYNMLRLLGNMLLHATS